MTPKRNDPCHCGSGKKYKHCHMKADREAEKATQSIAAPTSPPVPTAVSHPTNVPDEPQEIDPEVEKLNQLYEQFQAANYEEQIAILRNTITEQALDGELAFEFFNELYPHMVEQGEREEFGELTALLKMHQPEIYEEENAWFWSWEVANALALGDENALQQATDQLIKHGGEDLDQFYPVFESLLYHDRRGALLAAMNKHDFVVAQGKYFPGAEDEANQKLADLLVLNYIETQPQAELLATNNFDTLCTALAPYTAGLVRDRLENFIARAGGLTSDQWTMDDFQFVPPPPPRSWYEEEDEEAAVDPAVMHLSDLSSEFLHYARHKEQIPVTKADLARENLVRYILDRHRGELTDEKNATRPRPKKRLKKASKGKHTDVTNVLLPDAKTMDRYLTRFFGFLGNRHYQGAALFELIPTWVRFLESKGLTTTEEGSAALKSLQALSQSVVKILEGYESDPTLAENLRGWQPQA